MGNQARLLPTLESIDILMIDHSQYRPPVSRVDKGAGYGGSVVGLEFLGMTQAGTALLPELSI